MNWASCNNPLSPVSYRSWATGIAWTVAIDSVANASAALSPIATLAFLIGASSFICSEMLCRAPRPADAGSRVRRPSRFKTITYVKRHVNICVMFALKLISMQPWNVTIASVLSARECFKFRGSSK
jgi:hypothetical protein